MSLIAIKVFKCPRLSSVYANQIRTNIGSVTDGYWNKDWKPGPYPKTPEERAAAAKRYGLRPDEYKPKPDDGTGLGDYPDLPLISASQRDKFYDYDYPKWRRDWNEPIHEFAHHTNPERVDLSKKWAFPLWKQVLTYVGVMSTLFFLFYIEIFLGTGIHWPRMPKQMPGDGKAHYTFEPLD